ncbi:MAG: alpha/beta hydrolase [Bacteroidota bacterium]
MSITGAFDQVVRESIIIPSVFLDREVIVDLYFPPSGYDLDDCSILLVNDGQDLRTISFEKLLADLWSDQVVHHFLTVAIHAGKDRRMEYGTAGEPDYMGRGAKALQYEAFLLDELLASIHLRFPVTKGATVSVAGFSLGGLSALDLVCRHPDRFRSAGVFSGSLWWRSLAQEDPLYSDNKHRIMHQRIRKGTMNEMQRFFFQCGSMDEQKDRNRNGIIDSIDDTLDLIEELVQKGVPRSTHIYYLELADGKHDVDSWARAFPFFLRWNYSK